ncbi:hypothetical protein C8J56DRAFT_971759 [Mycena floridula]|nr:hypothetical protein C8J56DRAFT_971759 [Mycena floridula]
MHPSAVVQITAETVIDIAKTTIRAVKCPILLQGDSSSSQREACTVVASCWHVLNKHIYDHCQHATVDRKSRKSGKSQQSHFRCCFAGCTSSKQSNREKLQEHIDFAHMPDFPLPCPFKNCRNAPFYTSARLSEHVQKSHPDKIGVVSLDELLPSWNLSRPQLRDPPPLPSSIPLGSILVGEIPLSPTMSKLLKSSEPPPMSQWSQGSQQSPSKKRRQIAPRPPPPSAQIIDVDHDEENSISKYNFADLPVLEPSDFLKYMSIWSSPPQFAMDVARPIPPVDPSIANTEPPQTILQAIMERTVVLRPDEDDEPAS